MKLMVRPNLFLKDTAYAHPTVESTVREVLPHAIDTLQAAGYRLVTVAECLGLEAYTKVGAPGTPDVCTFSVADRCLD